MKTFTAVFCLMMMFCGCVSSPPKLPGDTIVNGAPNLRRDTLRAVGLYESAITKVSRPIVVVDTKIIRPPPHIDVERSSDMLRMKWEEKWTIRRADTNVAYSIEFEAHGATGTSIGVMLDTSNGTASTNVIEVEIK